MRFLALLALICAAMTPSLPAAAAQPIQVMVLGAYPFANPGQDLANVKVDDMLAPQRQAELAKLADELAAWKPTKIMVESAGAGGGGRGGGGGLTRASGRFGVNFV